MELLKSFKEFLAESELSTGSLLKAKDLIGQYFRNKVDKSFFASAGLENYSGGNGSGYGLRFYSPKDKKSIRFNWVSTSSTMNQLRSVDMWDGKSRTPKYHLEFEQDTSLVQILPVMADLFTGKEKIKKGSASLAPLGASLNEAFDLDLEFKNIAKDIVAGNSEGKIYKKYKSAGLKIFRHVRDNMSDNFSKKGKSFVWSSGNESIILSAKDQILADIGAIKTKISSGSKETYATSSSTQELEDNKERIAFEKQIQYLQDLTRLVVSGASNALFVAGRGGIGKTFNVEQTLSDLGLTDGNEYFKNTGSASAAGIYRLMAKYHDKILFFDDSDDALKDQQSRNLFKAATDTKKVRKIAWSKAGGNVAEPEDYESIEDLLDDGKIPRYFNFTGKVIFISNMDPDKLDPDGALRTRAFLIDINPTEEEIYEFIGKLADNFKVADGLQLSHDDRLRVVDMLKSGKSKQTANFRKAERGFNMMAGANEVNVKSDISELISLFA